MRFEVASHEILKHLNVASGAISPNPVLPVMEDFLFHIDNGKLTITTTNLESTIITSLNVNAEEDGIVTIPHKILLETIKSLPDQPLRFEVDENNSIKISSAFGVYKLSGKMPDDFPIPPKEEDVEALSIPGEKILRGIQNTLFATSNDEIRPAMTGVLMQVDFTKMHMVATDAHKLSKFTIGQLETDIARSIIVPKKGLILLKNALSEDDIVDISFNRSNVFFKFGSTKMICKLVDAKFPEYNAVIPVDNPFEAIINRKDFLSALRRINIYANKSTNQVIFNITEMSITLSAQDLDFANEATEQLNCVYNGDPMIIGFNAKFLGEMLSVLEGEEIKLELSRPNRAGILKPIELKGGEDLLMLVMPVMM